jgi:hypothetical protein
LSLERNVRRDDLSFFLYFFFSFCFPSLIAFFSSLLVGSFVKGSGPEITCGLVHVKAAYVMKREKHREREDRRKEERAGERRREVQNHFSFLLLLRCHSLSASLTLSLLGTGL